MAAPARKLNAAAAHQHNSVLGAGVPALGKIKDGRGRPDPNNTCRAPLGDITNVVNVRADTLLHEPVNRPIWRNFGKLHLQERAKNPAARPAATRAHPKPVPPPPNISFDSNVRKKIAAGITQEQTIPAIQDIDKPDGDDQPAVLDYIQDIYKFYKVAQNECRSSDYMAEMRGKLVDWTLEGADSADGKGDPSPLQRFQMAKEIPMQVFSVKHVLYEGSLRIAATVTDHARVVREWINNVSNSLENVKMKIVGLDAEYTQHVSGKIQRAAVLQLCVEEEVLVYHIMHAHTIPGELRDFMSRLDIFFCGAAPEGDKKMLAPYNIDVKHTADLQSKIHVEDCKKLIPSLFDVANFVLGTNLEKGEETRELRTSGWENYPLTYERIKYAAVDARVSYEIAARSKELVAKPSPTKNEYKKKKKKNNKKKKNKKQGIVDG